MENRKRDLGVGIVVLVAICVIALFISPDVLARDWGAGGDGAVMLLTGTTYITRLVMCVLALSGGFLIGLNLLRK